MARSFLTPINLNQNALQNAQTHPLGSAPSTPVVGQQYYNTGTNIQYYWNGSAWICQDATQLANAIPTSAILNFTSTVQDYHLNQFAAPTANVPMAGFKLTGLSTAPSTSGDSAEYSWVIGRNLNAIAGAAATTANVPMAGFTFTSLNTAPNGSGQAAEYSWVRGLSISTFSAPTANLAMAGYTITGLPSPTLSGQVAEYSWVLGRPLSAFAAPAANIPMAGYKLTGLNTTPSVAGDSAEYSWVIGQVQAAAAGIASKAPVNCVAVANVALTGLQTIDGYTTLAGDRVLLTGQTTTTQNGVYVAASGAWGRAVDDGAAPGEIQPGSMWMVETGTAYAGSQWRVATAGTITIGTTPVSIVQFGAASVYAAGNGITLTGIVFSVNALASGGIAVSGSGIAVDTTIVARKYSATIGDGSTTSIVVTHGLGTQDVVLSCRLAGTPYSVVDCDMSATSTNTVTFAFAVAPATASYRVTVLG